jgi:hypothetical protein
MPATRHTPPAIGGIGIDCVVSLSLAQSGDRRKRHVADERICHSGRAGHSAGERGVGDSLISDRAHLYNVRA